jgi:long-subunit acyl-CoA synthetase (AMP-forming)
MKGYLNLPQETAEVMREAGWLCTNDIGQMD